MLWKQLLILAAVLASPAFSAPAPQRKVPSSQQLNCDAGGVCCDQFGGCILRGDLSPEFEDRIVNKRDPEPQRKVPSSQQLTCTPNNQGVDVCCDQFGGCILRNDLSPEFEDRIVNKREAEPQALNCNKNNQGVDVCCDQFGGCILRNDLSPEFEDRIQN